MMSKPWFVLSLFIPVLAIASTVDGRIPPASTLRSVAEPTDQHVPDGCAGCEATELVYGWFGGLVIYDNGPANSGWLRVGDTWFKEFSEAVCELSVYAELEANSQQGVGGKVGIQAKVNPWPPARTCLKVTNYQWTLTPGVCDGIYPDCEEAGPCNFSLSCTLDVVGRLPEGAFFKFTDDQHTAEARHASLNPAESTIDLKRQLVPGCTNAAHDLSIEYTNSGWWFSYELFGQTARCTTCPTGF